MQNLKVNQKLKKNKYNILLFIAAAFVFVMLIIFIKNKVKESEISKYNNEILIVKGSGDQLDSLTLGEIRKIGSNKETIFLNNGVEKVEIEGVPLERIIGRVNYNLRDRPIISIEDNEGNITRFAMSAALEPGRVYLVYKIDDTPLYDLNPAYGKMAIIDTTSDSSKSRVTNVKTLDIQ